MQPASAETNSDQKPRRGNPHWQPGQSGNPRGAGITADRADKLFKSMAADFADLSAVDRTLLQRAALLLVRSERTRDTAAAVRMSQEARRVLSALQKRSRPRDPAPSLREYLASLPPERPVAPDDGPQDQGRESESLTSDAPKPAAGHTP